MIKPVLQGTPVTVADIFVFNMRGSGHGGKFSSFGSNYFNIHLLEMRIVYPLLRNVKFTGNELFRQFSDGLTDGAAVDLHSTYKSTYYPLTAKHKDGAKAAKRGLELTDCLPKPELVEQGKLALVAHP